MQSLEIMKKQLTNEGYKKIYVWQDSPNEIYSPHKHRTSTKLIILEGAMNLTLQRKVRKLTVGKIVEIKAYEVHSAIIGKNGCKYLIREGKK